MAFLPNQFLSNIMAKEGLAKPSRFQVILPIPTYVGNFIGQNVFEQLLNLPKPERAKVLARTNNRFRLTHRLLVICHYNVKPQNFQANKLLLLTKRFMVQQSRYHIRHNTLKSVCLSCVQMISMNVNCLTAG